MTTDMTIGTPSRLLWAFSIPMLLSVVFQQLYNVVDSVVAGQFVGVDALAAVGASFPVTMIFMAVATGANIGSSVVISQLFGAKDLARMKTAISTSVLTVAVLSLLLMAAGLWYCRPLLALLDTPANIVASSAVYLRIFLYGLPFLFLYNICNGVFTALGDSRTPLYFLIASSLANIVMDLVMVIVFDMGVAGVAWATFLCQGISSVLAAWALASRLRRLEHTGAFSFFSWGMLGRISLVAVPSILQQSFISVGNLFVQGLVNSFGSAVVAGYSAAIKLNTFALTSFSTLGSGLSSFTAQNMGAGKPERVTQGFRSALVMALAVAVPFCTAYFFFGTAMMGIFMETSNLEAVSVGVSFLRIVAPFYVVIVGKLMADGVLRGAGSMLAFMVATFSDLILRVVLAFYLAARLGSSTGIWLSWPIGWVIAAALSLGFYLSGSWKRNFFTR